MRRHWQLVWCAFSFCCYHAGHPTSRPREEAQQDADPAASPPTRVPAAAAGTGAKKQRGTQRATTPVLAGGPASGARMVGAVDHAAALLASVVRAAPTPSAAALA
jgi:hypothetical protein